MRLCEKPISERLLDKIAFIPFSECWEWIGGKFSTGYGNFADGLAHRASYEEFIGPIPADLQLDHKCRNRACVRPEHLEPVTCQENLLRSPITLAGINSRKEFCPQGHEYSGENLYVTPCKRRRCRICAVKRTQEWRARKCQMLLQ